MSSPDLPNAIVLPTSDTPSLCIPFIVSHFHSHTSPTPLIIGLNGVQGSGKSTLVAALSTTLSQPPSIPNVVVSIDDFYLPHSEQLALAASQPDNALLQQRGEPGTHDVKLLGEVLGNLRDGRETRVPEYDKSAFEGQGDRVVEEKWKVVNGPQEEKIRVIILEGWCVGFKSLTHDAVLKRRSEPSRTLHKHKAAHLLWVNEQLKGYEQVWDMFDLFIQIDTDDLTNVYDWRLEQEHHLRRKRGSGMTDDQVVRFVDGYYPAYELFTEGVRQGVFGDRRKGRQLRLVIDKNRKVVQMKVL